VANKQDFGQRRADKRLTEMGFFDDGEPLDTPACGIADYVEPTSPRGKTKNTGDGLGPTGLTRKGQ